MATSPDSITGTGVTNKRATCWSITINNPTEGDLKTQLPPGWNMTGQLEKGEQGTEHYQGMLTTPQVRFSAVKKALPRAHIEIARNKAALQTYVHKDETRVGDVADMGGVPSLFDFQHTCARDLIANLTTEEQIRQMYSKNDTIIDRLDNVVKGHIVNGTNGVEYIAINPMWISAWKKFGLAMLIREYRQTKDRQTDRQESKDEKTEESINGAATDDDQEDDEAHEA